MSKILDALQYMVKTADPNYSQAQPQRPAAQPNNNNSTFRTTRLLGGISAVTGAAVGGLTAAAKIGGGGFLSKIPGVGIARGLMNVIPNKAVRAVVGGAIGGAAANVAEGAVEGPILHHFQNRNNQGKQ